jgi:cytochrome P450
MVAEIDATLKAEALLAEFEQMRGIPYVEAVMNEAVRLKPVALMVGLEAARGTTLADLTVPAGTRVFCLTRPGAVDPSRATDAAEFNPDRRMNQDAAEDRALRGASLPFGAGPRICPGR